MNPLKKGGGVPLLNFVGGPEVPLLNFEGGPGVPLLNFRGVPGPFFKLWGGSGSRVPGSWSHFYTMPFWRTFATAAFAFLIKTRDAFAPAKIFLK